MKINKTTQIASLIVGGLLAYPILKPRKKEAQSYFAFVKDANGEPIYENPTGGQAIARLSQGEYVGALTGKTNGDFFEVESSIGEENNKRKYHFWIYKAAVVVVEGQEATRQYMLAGNGSEKSQTSQRAIVKHFA